MGKNFYPRPPRGGRPPFLGFTSVFWAFLSTPSARRATFEVVPQNPVWCIISIHALREEGDALRHAIPDAVVDFYPRPPRGGRPQENAPEKAQKEISIHALREEGD